MKVLTYTLNKVHYDLYPKMHRSIAVNSCQIELGQKESILLSKISLIVYKTGKCPRVKNTDYISFTLSEGIYSIDHFNVKIKVAIIQQRQDWKPPQMKDSRLFIPEEYLFMTNNTIFYALGIQDNYLETTTLIRSTLPPGSYKASLDASPLPNILSLHYKQINKAINKLDGQPSRLLTSMHVSHYNATFSPIHLVFLYLDTDRPHLDFKIFDEKNNEVILRGFNFQLLNKE